MLWYTTGLWIHFRHGFCHYHFRRSACSKPRCLRKATKTQSTAAHSEHSSKLRGHKLPTDSLLEIKQLAMTLKICSMSSLSCATNRTTKVAGLAPFFIKQIVKVLSGTVPWLSFVLTTHAWWPSRHAAKRPFKQSASNLNEALLFLLDYLRTPN